MNVDYERARESLKDMNDEVISNAANVVPDRVFVIFDTERGQIECIRKHIVLKNEGTLLNSQNAIDQAMAGASCSEAPEPSDILYENLGVPRFEMWKRDIAAWLGSAIVLGFLFTLLWRLTVEQQRVADEAEDVDLADGGIAAAKQLVSRGFAFGVAAMISCTNLALPVIMKKICSMEIHTSQTSFQRSMMIKLTIVRWLNTAVLTFLVTRKKEFVSETLVTKVQGILLADLILGPALRLVDVYNLVMRYGVGPKTSATQTKLNKYFYGTYWNLAERYTDISKSLFICFFFAAILPSGYLVVAVVSLITYFIDKYLLFNRWRTPPALDDSISNMQRRFFILMVMVHSIVTLYFYRRWPYNCDVIADPSELQECEASLAKSPMQGEDSFSQKTPDMNSRTASGNAFYIGVFVLMLCTIAVVIYYFCFRQIKEQFNRMCGSVEKKLDARTGRGGDSAVRYSKLHRPDYYGPRVQAVPQLSTPENMSNIMHVFQSILRKELVDPNWQWAGQISPAGMSTADVEKPDEQGLFESNLLWITRTYISNSADVTAQSMPRYRTVGHGGPNGQMGAFSGMWGQQTGTLFPQQIFFQQQQQQPPVVVGQLAPQVIVQQGNGAFQSQPQSVGRMQMPGSTGVLAMNIGR